MKTGLNFIILFLAGAIGAALLIGDSNLETWQLIIVATVFFFVTGFIIGIINPKQTWIALFVPWFMLFAFARLLFTLPDTDLRTLAEAILFILAPSALSFTGALIASKKAHKKSQTPTLPT